MEEKLDIHQYDKKYKSAIKSVENAEIPQKSRELILAFGKDYFHSLSKPRRIKYLRVSLKITC